MITDHTEIAELSESTKVEESYDAGNEELQAQVLAAVRDLDSSRFRLGGLLEEVRRTGVFRSWGFTSFRGYVESECQLSARSAQSLIRIHEIFISRVGLAAEDLEAIGWSKAQVVASAVERAHSVGGDVQRVLGEARRTPLRKLRRKFKHCAESGGEVPCRAGIGAAGHGESEGRAAVLGQLSAMILVMPRVRWPSPPADFVIDRMVWQQLCYAVDASKHTLVTGPSGSGKTEIVKRCADAHGRPIAVFNFGAMSEPRTSLVGTMHYVPESGTVFSESRFVQALKTPGCCVLLDEINRCTPDAYNMLLPLLDGQRTFALDEDAKAPVVHLAANVCFFATANIGSEYHGAEAIDKAVKDRFSLVVPLWFPNVMREARLLRTRVNGLDELSAKKLCKFAARQRELWQEGEFAELISTRALLAAAEQIPHGFPLKDALTFSVVNQFSDEGGEKSDRTKLQQLLQSLG